MSTSRGANGLAAALVGAAYLVRGIGDATGTVDAGDGLTMTAGWLSWLSPIGWGQRTSPFSAPTIWPALLGLAVGAIAAAGALALRSRRDIDASIIPQRPGRAHARATLAGPISPGLAGTAQSRRSVGSSRAACSASSSAASARR